MASLANIAVFVLFASTLSAAFVSGQRAVWLLMPNQNYLGQNRMSSRENEIPNTEAANFRPIYFFNQFHDPSRTRSSHLPTTSRFLYHPQQIAPFFITEHGHGRNPSPKTNLMFPQHFSNEIDERENYNDDGEAVFNSEIDNIFLNAYNYGISRGTIKKEEQEEEDNNSSSSSSGSTEFEVDNFSNLRQPHHHLQPEVAPLEYVQQGKEERMRPPPSSTVNVIISHSDQQRQRCILEGHQARYDPITGGCYTVGTKGPCGKFMIFTTIPNDNLNGFCDCDYDSVERPMALLGGKCHFLYTQAICYPGYWLTSVAPNGKPICQENPCDVPSSSPSSNSKNAIVPYKGECIPLNSPSIHCRREGEVVLFPKGSTQPTCGFPKSTKRIYRRQISNVGRFMCRPGMRRHRVTRKCVRTRAIVFHQK